MIQALARGISVLHGLNIKKQGMLNQELFIKAVSMDDKNPLFLNNLGGVCFFLGHYDESMQYLNKAREIDPSYGRAYANLATVHYQRGELEQTVKMLENFVASSPSAPDYSLLDSKLLQLRGK